MAAGTILATFPGKRILRQTPDILRSLLASATPEDLDWQPAPDRWSISMVLAHLADVELKGFVSRFRAIAEQDNPFLHSYDQLDQFRIRRPRGARHLRAKAGRHVSVAGLPARVGGHRHRTTRRAWRAQLQPVAQRVCLSRPGAHSAGDRALPRPRVLSEHGRLPKLLQNPSLTRIPTAPAAGSSFRLPSALFSLP